MSCRDTNDNEDNYVVTCTLYKRGNHTWWIFLDSGSKFYHTFECVALVYLPSNYKEKESALMEIHSGTKVLSLAHGSCRYTGA